MSAAIQKIVRICPHCFDETGDTFEFDSKPPVGIICDDCGSRLQPMSPEPYEREGWLGGRDYSEPYDDAARSLA